eukprot:gene22825-28998_t
MYEFIPLDDCKSYQLSENFISYAYLIDPVNEPVVNPIKRPLRIDSLYGQYIGEGNALNQKHGRGNKYDGEWFEDKICGHGKMEHKNGDVYVGEWALDDDNVIVSGEMTWHTGATYSGQWRGALRHGFGIMRKPNGDLLYEGLWENDHEVDMMNSSQQQMTIHTATGVYTGQVNAAGRKHGRGVMRWTHGDDEGCEYDGEWANNCRVGQGTMKWNNGNSYTGEWKADFKTSVVKGTMTFHTGAVYCGWWRGIHMEGEGVLRDGAGHVLHEGRFKRDEFVLPGYKIEGL